MSKTKKKEPKIACRRRYIGSDLYRALLLYYPDLKKKDWYMRFMLYLLYPTRVDPATGQAIIPQAGMYRIVGRTHICGKDYIMEYREATGHMFSFSPYVPQQRARAVSELNLHPDVQELYEKDLMHASPSRIRVDECGKLWSKRTAKRDAELMEQEMLAEIAERVESLEDSVAVALGYMNARPFELFHKAVMKHGDEAAAIAKQIEDSDIRKHTMRDLACIFDNPKQFYAPSERSTRLAPMGTGLATLKREARKAITQDWWTVDLASAQLAVLAMELKLPLLTEYLKSGKSVWAEFMAWLNTTKKWEVKNLALYPFVFGSDIASIKKNFDQALYEGATERLKTHPFIQEIIAARAVQREQIKKDGGAYSCYGTWIPVPPETKYAHGKFDALNYRSVPAQLAQAWEFKLIFPIFKLAMENPDVFQIALYQFDGCSLAFADPRPERTNAWKGRIKAAVAEVAAEHGIHTRLVEED